MDELKEKYVGKWIGPNKITDISITELTTSAGSVVFEVTYELGHKELFPEKGLALVVTDEIKDLNFVRDVRVAAITPLIVETIKEYDLPAAQVNYLFSKAGQEVDNHFARAYNFLMFGNEIRYAPGFEPQHDYTLLMAERVNKKIPPRE